MWGDEIGTPQIEEAHNKDVTLTMNSTTNSTMFNRLSSYITSGGETLIIYTATTRKTYSGSYTCGYDYLSIDSMSIEVSYTYRKSTGTIGSATTGSAVKLNITAFNSSYSHKATWK